MGWSGRAPAPLVCKLWGFEPRKEHVPCHGLHFSAAIATIGIDLGKNTFHRVGQDERGAIVLRIKLSRSQLVQRLANLPPCLIGMEACAGAHHIGRQLQALGHDVRLIPAQYVEPFLKGHKNDYRDTEAIAEAVQRPTMSFVAISLEAASAPVMPSSRALSSRGFSNTSRKPAPRAGSRSQGNPVW